ncbi:MAG: C_GCAxxG_C_C family protein [Clostridia bacterium]|nr:C_GCAxxG_C_C family protein [Clostridia bacterium]
MEGIFETSSFEERAVDFFMKGYNCSQAVYAAFVPVLDVEEKDALRIASAFGGGFGRLRHVCGAFSGVTLVLGHFFGYDDPSDEKKDTLYPRVQELSCRFEKSCGSIVCREILKNNVPVGGTPSPRTKEYYESRPCARVVGQAAKILEEYLREEGCL